MTEIAAVPGLILRRNNVPEHTAYQPGDIVVLKTPRGDTSWNAYCLRKGKDDTVNPISRFWEVVNG